MMASLFWERVVIKFDPTLHMGVDQRLPTLLLCCQALELYGFLLL
jgi:hypothetical protein